MSLKPGLCVLFGRRRIGKTSLIQEWMKSNPAAYSQAIEGAASLQIGQLVQDIRGILPAGIEPKNWPEFFELLRLQEKATALVIDEFPYLVKSSPELPSLLQKWLDHDMPKGFQLILLGSSQTMMHGTFLESHSPLYERAGEIIHLAPLSYAHFCEAERVDGGQVQSFTNFSLIGGIPKYWEFIDAHASPEENADLLFFQKTARLLEEPDRLLKDENITGQQAKSIFECIGRGARRPSEIAGRLGIAQSSLSSPLLLLKHAHLVGQESPFPGTATDTKKSLYTISDFALRFWYHVFSPHRSRWHLYDKKTQHTLVHEHAALVLEDCFRSLYQDAQRYWEGKNIEIDAVRYDPNNLKNVIITEMKLRNLTRKEKEEELDKLKAKFKACKLSRKFSLGACEVLGGEDVLSRIVESCGSATA